MTRLSGDPAVTEVARSSAEDTPGGGGHLKKRTDNTSNESSSSKANDKKANKVTCNNINPSWYLCLSIIHH